MLIQPMRAEMFRFHNLHGARGAIRTTSSLDFMLTFHYATSVYLSLKTRDKCTFERLFYHTVNSEIAAQYNLHLWKINQYFTKSGKEYSKSRKIIGGKIPKI